MSTTLISPRVLELLRFTEAHQWHTEALARATGEHFNIFHILRIGHLEVKTHSPILGDLLNPKGSHGQGAAFLRLFLDQFGIKGFDAESPTAKVDLEYHIGEVTERSGGRIDIVVTDGRGRRLFIENKIYASDQENQMERYWDYDQNAHLFYLTRDGRLPSNRTQADLDRIQCRRISYAEHILVWLRNCRKEAACQPRVRETLSQYIHLVEDLTNQSTATRMNSELCSEILKDQASLAAFFKLHAQYEAVRADLIGRFEAQLDKYAKAAGLTPQPAGKALHEADCWRWFSVPRLERANVRIGIGFEKKGFGDFFFGFAAIDPIKQPVTCAAEVRAAFAKRFGTGKRNDYWLVWAYWEHPYTNWGARGVRGHPLRPDRHRPGSKAQGAAGNRPRGLPGRAFRQTAKWC